MLRKFFQRAKKILKVLCYSLSFLNSQPVDCTSILRNERLFLDKRAQAICIPGGLRISVRLKFAFTVKIKVEQRSDEKFEELIMPSVKQPDDNH